MDRYHHKKQGSSSKEEEKEKGQRPCVACGSPVTGELDSNGDVVGFLTCAGCGKNQFYKSRLNAENYKFCYICRKRGHVNIDCPLNKGSRRMRSVSFILFIDSLPRVVVQPKLVLHEP